MDQILIWYIIFTSLKVILLIILGILIYKYFELIQKFKILKKPNKKLKKKLVYRGILLSILIIIIISFFQLESAHRPKTDMNKSTGPKNIQQFDSTLKVNPEIKEDYQQLIKDSHEQNKQVRDQFKKLE
jgi:heme/copper-type cytochrome/quinol oxidase subunit 2